MVVPEHLIQSQPQPQPSQGQESSTVAAETPAPKDPATPPINTVKPNPKKRTLDETQSEGQSRSNDKDAGTRNKKKKRNNKSAGGGGGQEATTSPI